MARPRKGAPAPSSLLPALLRLVRERDAAAGSLLALRLGIEDDAIEKDEVSATEAMVEEALEEAATLLAEPHLSLRLPADLPLRRYGLAELAARSTTTLREGLARMATYASLVHPAITCVLEESGDEAQWIQRTPSRPRGVGRHAEDYALAYVLTYARRETGAPIAPSRVWFAHPRPPDIAPLHRFFGSRDLSFGCEDSGIALPRSILDLPLRTADARLLATADDLAKAALRALPRPTDFAAAVALRVESLLPDGAGMGAVAGAMRMSERTLQRKLDAEGASFSEIVDDVRERLARRWLKEEGRTLSEIAFSLGFSDLATFSRAFKRWTGKPPGAWRRG
ncbi:MAG: AraC family transcriptional regulator ligand-binding domain-containing protein [Polyangiaceae bacterium]